MAQIARHKQTRAMVGKELLVRFPRATKPAALVLLAAVGAGGAAVVAGIAGGVGLARPPDIHLHILQFSFSPVISLCVCSLLGENIHRRHGNFSIVSGGKTDGRIPFYCRT